jgi:hypothetical protein
VQAYAVSLLLVPAGAEVGVVAAGVEVGVVAAGVVSVGVGAVSVGVEVAGVGVVGDRLGLVPASRGAREEETPRGTWLLGVCAGQCQRPASLHDGALLESETACMAGIAVEQAVRADATPMAARTVRARDNLIIGNSLSGGLLDAYRTLIAAGDSGDSPGIQMSVTAAS